VINQDLNPAWNENFELWAPVGGAEGTEDEPTVHLQVYDQDPFDHDFLGDVKIPLESLRDKGPVQGWHRLEPQGKIRLILEWCYEPEAGKVSGKNKVESEKHLKEAKVAQETAEDAYKKKKAEQLVKREESQAAISEGEYEVRVHIIEVRDLRPMDGAGVCDPYTEVNLFGEVQQTAIHSERNSCYFDDVFFYTKRDVGEDYLQLQNIKIRVMDHDLLSYDDVVGTIEIDLLECYYRESHEMYRQWAALSSPEGIGTSEDPNGYILFTITVLGPGDEAPKHDLAKEEAEENAKAGDKHLGSVTPLTSMCLLSPKIKTELWFLVFTIFKVNSLPRMDSSLFSEIGLTQDSIDCYVSVNFAGAECQTMPVYASQNPTFEQEIWLPVMLPTLAKTIKVELWDYDMASYNDLVGTAYFSFGNAPEGKPPEARWVNFYGAPVSVEYGEAKNDMNRYPAMASHYRGRMLYTMRKVKARDSDPVAPHLVHARTLPEPKPIRYTLRVSLITAAEIPQLYTHLGSKLSIGVCISVGHTKVIFPPQEFAGGYFDFVGKAIQTEDFSVTMIMSDMLDPKLLHYEKDEPNSIMYPLVKSSKGIGKDEQCEVPDICVRIYTCPRGKEPKPGLYIDPHCNHGKCVTGEHMPHGMTFPCYKRIPARQLIQKGFGPGRNEPFWCDLKEDDAHDMLSDDEFPGSILLRCGFGPEEEQHAPGCSAENNPWVMEAAEAALPENQMEYDVRVFLYKGVDLEGADEGNLLDPYVKSNFKGQSQTSPIQYATREPEWFHTFRYLEKLPKIMTRDAHGQFRAASKGGRVIIFGRFSR
jgi:hypothetical protein